MRCIDTHLTVVLAQQRSRDVERWLRYRTWTYPHLHPHLHPRIPHLWEEEQ